MISKELIKSNFSKCAKVYDAYSTVQRLSASRLIKMVGAGGFTKILDIGCGTGNYTRLLCDRFPQAQIKAIDISREMVRASRKKLSGQPIEFIIADAESIKLKEQFDLVSSNAAFQWLEDLGVALEKYKGYLKQGGLILFSIFGPRTFCELESSLKIFFQSNLSITASDFIDKAKISGMLKNTFSNVEVEEEIYREEYVSLKDLLKSIKYTGTRGNMTLKQNFWTLKSIAAIEDIYLRNFNNIIATYQIYFCRGTK